MVLIKKFRIKNFKTNKEILRLDKICIYLENRRILNNITFGLNEGEVLGILGPNGAGKTTIFNSIIGLIKPFSGTIYYKTKKINDLTISTRTKKFKIAYVPQYGGYFQDLTLLENLKLISEMVIDDKKIRKEKIDSMLGKFELETVSNIKVGNLSGGQKKKLVIALSLLSKPEILLLDEPFAALDIMTIKNLQEIIVNLQMENRISIILCDHQARDLLSCVDKAIVLTNNGIVAIDTPNNLVKNIEAQKAYFGKFFKIN